jgi:hypothetical protein
MYIYIYGFYAEDVIWTKEYICIEILDKDREISVSRTLRKKEGERLRDVYSRDTPIYTYTHICIYIRTEYISGD